MRMRPVRHFSRALHQVSVCVRKSARHSQVRSPNMRTSQHIVAVSVRVVHIAPVSRGLHGQMRRVGTTCKPQRRSSLGKKSCSRYATIDDFSCTETQADGSLFPKASEKTFFLFEMSRSKQNNNNTRATVLPLPRISHGTARPDCCCVSAAPHLHCVSWPHPNTGRSPVRPIAVVVYLIRPNRGLTAVLLGKSTTTTKNSAQQARGSRETLFFLFFPFFLFISFK